MSTILKKTAVIGSAAFMAYTLYNTYGYIKKLKASNKAATACIKNIITDMENAYNDAEDAIDSISSTPIGRDEGVYSRRQSMAYSRGSRDTAKMLYDGFVKFHKPTLRRLGIHKVSTL